MTDTPFLSPRVRGLLGTAALLLSGLVLTGCLGKDGPPPPCPKIVTVKDAEQQTRFQGEGRDLTDVLFEAGISARGVTCDYDDGEIEIEMQVVLQAVRGPASQTQEAALRYFVAVVRSDLTVLAREEFDSVVPLPGNRTRAALAEEVSPTIPLATGQSGRDFQIFIGLVLNEAEFEYNRANR